MQLNAVVDPGFAIEGRDIDSRLLFGMLKRKNRDCSQDLPLE